jgi:excisionase family DNA binding protein
VSDVPQLLKAKQVADLLAVDVDTVYKLAERGILPSVRLGDGYRAPVRFPKEELAAWVKSKIWAKT